METVRINPLRESFIGKAVGSLLKQYINGNLLRLDWYERCLCRLMPADSIHFTLRSKKEAAALLPAPHAA